jgi:general secretion pathway protein K
MTRNTTGSRPQRGAALLAAMLTVTLVATFSAMALWQQWRNVEVESAERSRQQTAWLLTGALDWARLILREDARSGTIDHLAEPWAVPLQEARLSSFLAVDTSNNSDSADAPQAFLSGHITDMQSRMNVFNLVVGNQLSKPDGLAFGKLFELLGLPPAELGVLANNLRLALDTKAAAGPLLPQRLEQLPWLGLSPQTLSLLKPYITWLPDRTPVNLNTASAPVIYASIPTFEMSDAQRLVTERERTQFRTLAEAAKDAAALSDHLSVSSRFFEVRGRLRNDQTLVQERSLVQRDGMEVKTLWREREVMNTQVRELPAQPPTLPTPATATAPSASLQ